ncbi:MAG: hypothetical protein EOP83_06025 [Verrucomicrobiaceae bacterium]|nr:MAG: hypothetical protein EOP83_06025 [Verrucomicrobiaceae bacterium]
MAVPRITNPRKWWDRYWNRIILDASSIMTIWMTGREIYSKKFDDPTVEDWLNEHCPSGWDWKPKDGKGHLILYNPDEAFAFKMRWL